VIWIKNLNSIEFESRSLIILVFKDQGFIKPGARIHIFNRSKYFMQTYIKDILIIGSCIHLFRVVTFGFIERKIYFTLSVPLSNI